MAARFYRYSAVSVLAHMGAIAGLVLATHAENQEATRANAPMTIELLQIEETSDGSGPTDLTNDSSFRSTLGDAFAVLDATNAAQTNCTDDRGEKKLCPRALWGQIEKHGLEVLSESDRRFFLRYHSAKKVALDGEPLRRFLMIQEKVKLAGQKKLAGSELQAWLRWDDPAAKK